jgi:hypothetical protein
VVGGDVGDEIGRVVQTDRSISKFDFHFVLRLFSCHSEGAFVATEESRTSKVEILRFAQDDIMLLTI